MEGVLLREVLRQCSVWVAPRPEGVEFSPNLRRPHAGSVSEVREVGVGFDGLGGLARCRGRSRMNFGHGNVSSQRGCCGYWLGIVTILATMFVVVGVKETQSE